MGRRQAATAKIRVRRHPESRRGGPVGARVRPREVRRGVVVLAPRDRGLEGALDLRRGFVNLRAGVLLALRAHARGLLRDPTQPRAAQGERRGAEQRHGGKILRVPHRRIAFLCANVDTGHQISCVRARKGALALAAVRVFVLDGLCGSWGSPAMRKAAFAAFLRLQKANNLTAEAGPAPIGPSPPTRREVCGIGAQRVLQVSILFFLALRLRRGITRQCPLPGGIPRHSRGWGIDTTLRRAS